jgi:hypothetical protein
MSLTRFIATVIDFQQNLLSLNVFLNHPAADGFSHGWLDAHKVNTRGELIFVFLMFFADNNFSYNFTNSKLFKFWNNNRKNLTSG